jgi:hypothetical protein
VGAAALYGAVLADALLHAGRFAAEFAPAAGAGSLLLAVALLRGGARTLGWALFLAGASYVGALAARRHGVDGTAPLVATALLLCGELARWSRDLRVRIQGAELLARRRAAAVAALALCGLAASGLAVGVAAAPAGRGLGWTVLGAASAVGAAGVGAWLARRPA